MSLVPASFFLHWRNQWHSKLPGKVSFHLIPLCLNQTCQCFTNTVIYSHQILQELLFVESFNIFFKWKSTFDGQIQFSLSADSLMCRIWIFFFSQWVSLDKCKITQTLRKWQRSRSDLIICACRSDPCWHCEELQSASVCTKISCCLLLTESTASLRRSAIFLTLCVL